MRIKVSEQFIDNLAEPLVTVLCSTLDDADSISQAIESILIQETSFAVRIVVCDFGSTDGTCERVLQYCDMYPYLIDLITDLKGLQSSDTDASRPGKQLRLGKYLAICSGSDYWTEPSKLQTQAEFLEAHPEATFIVHNVRKVFAGNDLGLYDTETRGKWFDGHALLRGQLGARSSKLIRSHRSVSHTLPQYPTSEAFANLLDLRLGLGYFSPKVLAVKRLKHSPNRRPSSDIADRFLCLSALGKARLEGTTLSAQEVCQESDLVIDEMLNEISLTNLNEVRRFLNARPNKPVDFAIWGYGALGKYLANTLSSDGYRDFIIVDRRFSTDAGEQIGRTMTPAKFLSSRHRRDCKLLITTMHWREVLRELNCDDFISICNVRVVTVDMLAPLLKHYFRTFPVTRIIRKLWGTRVKKLSDYYYRGAFISNRASIFNNPHYLLRDGLSRHIEPFAKVVTGDILDFGCGSSPYKSLFEACESYTGVDIRESGHPKKDSKIDLYYDGSRLPLLNNRFDCVFSSEVLEHVPNVEEILGEINRVLKPKGLLVFTVPFAWEEHETPYDYARYTRDGLEQLLKKTNFRVKLMVPTNSHFVAISQLLINYIFLSISSRSKFFLFLKQLGVVFPMNVLTLLLNRLLPARDTFYSNIFCIAEKT